MKKILTFLILLIAVPCFAHFVPGWANFSGTSTNPLITAYYTTLYANALLPITTNSGTIGASGNAFNSSWQDTVGFTSSIYFWQNGSEIVLAGATTLKATTFSPNTGMQQTGTGGTWAKFIGGKTQYSGYSTTGAQITTNDTVVTFHKRGSAPTLLAIDSLGNIDQIDGAYYRGDSIKADAGFSIAGNMITSIDTTAAGSTVITFSSGRTITFTTTKGP